MQGNDQSAGAPARGRTRGETLVRTDFNPSADSLVDRIKQKHAELIDLVDEVSRSDPSSDRGRHCSLSITHLETSAMYAVKAATTPKA